MQSCNWAGIEPTNRQIIVNPSNIIIFAFFFCFLFSLYSDMNSVIHQIKKSIKLKVTCNGQPKYNLKCMIRLSKNRENWPTLFHIIQNLVSRVVWPKCGHLPIKFKSEFLRMKNRYAKIANKLFVSKLFHLSNGDFIYFVACLKQLQTVKWVILKFRAWVSVSELNAIRFGMLPFRVPIFSSKK